MPKQDDQQRPVEGDGTQPKKLVLAEREAVLVAGTVNPGLVVAEQRAESQHLETHAGCDAPAGRRIVDGVRLDPGERFLLSASGGDAERHRSPSPAQHAIAEADEEDCERSIGNRHRDECAPAVSSSGHNADQDQHQNRDQRIEDVHNSFLSPSLAARESCAGLRSPECRRVAPGTACTCQTP